MNVAEHQEGAVTILQPDGPLLAEDAEQFARAFRSAAQTARYRVAIDCARLTHLDSVGLETLADAGESTQHAGRSLALIGAGETLRETLVLTEIDALFQHFADANAAIRSFL